MADYRVGRIERPTVALADAVAASSAFPPVLSPMRIVLNPAAIRPEGADLQEVGFRNHAVLADGGVYDNLGLETVWKRYQTVLVSDAGAKIAADPDPHGDWARGATRIFELVDNQVRSLRKRQLMASFTAAAGDAARRSGAYWGIRSDIGKYGAPGKLPCPLARTSELAAVPTRLAKLDAALQERLINWGYAVCDAALRTHFDPSIPVPRDFPYAGGV